MIEDKYLVELLEQRLVQEVVNYRHTLDENWETEKYDKSYFPIFFSETLMAEFKEWIYSKVNKLNNFEINKFLSLSLEQFKTHKPDYRKQEIEKMYHLIFWYPNVMPDNKLSLYDKNFLSSALRSYDRYFNTYLSITEKMLIDFKAGLIGSNATFQSVPPSEQTKEKIAFRDFKVFLKHLEFNYPYKIDVITFKYFLRDDIEYLKKEILENFLNINHEEKIAYINRIKYEIESLQKNVWANYNDIEKWFNKYEISEEEIFTHQNFSNELYRLLSIEPPTFRETFEPDYNIDTEDVQKSFYNYYYGQSINTILDFISEHEIKLNPSAQTNLSKQKIKTNLSVPQLACLFRALLDNKIIDIPVKANLYRFISESFESKGTLEISTKKIKNLFEDPDLKEFEFWDEKFLKLKQYTFAKKNL